MAGARCIMEMDGDKPETRTWFPQPGCGSGSSSRLADSPAVQSSSAYESPSPDTWKRELLRHRHLPAHLFYLYASFSSVSFRPF